MEQAITAIIAADDERLAQSIQALLLAMPQVGSAAVIDDRDSIAQDMADLHPAIVLLALDADLPATVAALQAACPETVFVALAIDRLDQEAALAAGADLAFVRGYPAAQLYQAILQALEDAIQKQISSNQ